MRVLVVVLNYRTPDLTVQCLHSLENEVRLFESMRVVVTDNDSGDGSVEKIGSAIEANGWDWCTLLPLAKNGGFCFGNNAGIRPALRSEDPPDYVMLVNPDAYVRENAVSQLVRFMDAHPEVGIAGARVEYPDGTRQNSAFRFPSTRAELLGGINLGILDTTLHRYTLYYRLGDEPMKVDWVSGAAMIIRREVFDDIGLLDEGFFLYFDEVDFCLRARRAGWLTYYVPKAAVVHLMAQATGFTNEQKTRYPDYWFNSRRRFYIKNYGKLRAMAADVAFLAGCTTFRVRCVIQRKHHDQPTKFLSDFVRNSTLAKGFQL